MLATVKNEVFGTYDTELLKSLKNHFIITILNSTGKIIYANNNFSKVFRGSNTKDQLQGSDLLRRLVQSREVYWEICTTLLAGHKWQGVLVHKDTNDKTYSLETAIWPISDANSDRVNFVAVSNDISDHYCKERTSKVPYSDDIHVIQNITKDTLFITKQGKIFNTSRSVLNNTYDSIVGSNVFDFVNPLNHDHLQKLIDLVFDDGKIGKYQFIGTSSKGTQAFYVTKIKPVFNLQNEVIYATLKSKKHINGSKIHKELKAVETKYSNIFHSINVGIIMVANSQGYIIEWNKGAEKAFGYTDAEIIGEHWSIIIAKTHVESRVKNLLDAKGRLDNNLSAESMEMLGLKKSGEEFPVELTMSNWQTGNEKFYCAIMIDVSRRKKLEQRLRKTTEDLELFLYRSAHDLKAPLTSAEGLLNLLKDEDINKEAAVLVDMLDQTLTKGRLLLDDLAFASIISEKCRELTPIKFREKIENVMTSLQGIANFDTIDFKINIHQECDFYFNQELMDSVFQNLIHNAIIFAKPKMKNHSATTQINVEVFNKEAHIVVADNGVGIDPDQIDRVFDLYSRSENSTGTGLGLYIVKRIVENFHGDISVQSKPNEGASFHVVLPNLMQENIDYD